MIFYNPFRDRLHDRCLTGLSWCYDHCALPLPNRTKNVDDTIGQFRFATPLSSALKDKLLIRVHRTQLTEFSTPLSILWRLIIDSGQIR
tara:strand:+ start:99 stop:365 length:267 start_codon:yes stop_codon:yes gene_type:complete